MNEDRSARYHRLKRRAGALSLTWSCVVLALALISGVSASLRDIAAATTASLPLTMVPTATVVAYVAMLAVLHELATMPATWYGYALERRYALSEQTAAAWLTDQLKGLALSIGLGGIAAAVIYGFIRRSAEGWWLPTGAVFALLVVGVANLGPVLLLPLFYTVKPLQRESLKARLLALADRAGARVIGAYEWGLGRQTRKANAALTGLGATRRILVSDTMLADYSDEEIEVVLAHELAHHVHGDIWTGIVYESVLLVAGCFVAARLLPAAISSLGLRGADDVAGLPILLFVVGGLSIIMLPLAHAMSRTHERRADRFALRLTRNPAAFVSAMKRLGAQNLAEEHPSRLVQWLFYSHPPMRERIAAAQQFRG